MHEGSPVARLVSTGDDRMRMWRRRIPQRQLARVLQLLQQPSCHRPPRSTFSSPLALSDPAAERRSLDSTTSFGASAFLTSFLPSRRGRPAYPGSWSSRGIRATCVGSGVAEVLRLEGTRVEARTHLPLWTVVSSKRSEQGVRHENNTRILQFRLTLSLAYDTLATETIEAQ
jgi:hypothetical protein